MNALIKIEPISLPDIQRMDRMPSWPAWVASRIASLQKNEQRDAESGRYRELWTLPANLIPTDDHRKSLTAHAAELGRRLEQTPEREVDLAKATLVIVTKMMLVLPAQKANETAAEAQAEAYLDALDDVPSWAVQAAIRGWHRSAYGDKYSYKWRPQPAELREVSFLEAWKVRSRIAECEKLLQAQPLFEPEPEHSAAMLQRTAEVPKLPRM